MSAPPQSLLTALEAAVARARNLAGSGSRMLLGITGMPGAGKSTLATRLVDALTPRALCVPMDGFHIANTELTRLGRRQRKGAADTFDVAGYIALLRRLRTAETGEVVYAPSFDRGLDEPIAGAIAVAPEVALVVTEGNYLLMDGDWRPVRDLLHEIWYVQVAEEDRIAGLVARHASFGKSEDEARHWALGSDQANAELIAATAHRADVLVHLDLKCIAIPTSG